MAQDHESLGEFSFLPTSDFRYRRQDRHHTRRVESSSSHLPDGTPNANTNAFRPCAPSHVTIACVTIACDVPSLRSFSILVSIARGKIIIIGNGFRVLEGGGERPDFLRGWSREPIMLTFLEQEDVDADDVGTWNPVPRTRRTRRRESRESPPAIDCPPSSTAS